MILKFKKLTPEAILPSYAHSGDAGLDMYASETMVINPGQPGKVKTGVAVEIPEGYVGLIWDKSGMAFNNRLKTLSGVIDSGYRGEALLSLINLGDKPVTIEKGQKVSQMLIQKIETVEVVEAEELSDTSRGEGGFGSTGRK